MIKENKHHIIDAIIYYRVPNMLIGMLTIFMLGAPILDIVSVYFPVKEGSFYYKAFYLLIYWLPLCLWAYQYFVNCRILLYKKLTDGRKYTEDSKAFNKTFHWLVDFYKKADPHRLDTSKAPQGLNWTDVNGIVMGMTYDKRLIYIPPNCESNICTFGPPGSGKTVGHAKINAITFNKGLGKNGAGYGVLAIDVKGDLYSYVSTHSKRRILRFCPDSPNALKESIHFDPLAGYNELTHTDQKLFLSNMSIIIVPEEGGESGAYFTGRARRILRSIATYMLWKDPNTSFSDIVHGILQGNIFDWANEISSSDCIPAKELILSLMDGNEKNAGGAYDTLCTALDPLSNEILDVLLSNKHGKCITAKHLEKGYDIYLQIDQDHLEVYAPLFTLIIQSFMTQFMKRQDCANGAKNVPILFLLDEFAQLSFSYKMANTAFSTLRSKGIVIDMLLQDRAQLEMKYERDGARALLSCCNYQLILGSNDSSSSQAYSELFGKKKVLIQSTSQSNISSQNSSSGISVTEQYEDIYSPQDFGDLPASDSLIIYFKGKHAKLKKLKAV